MTRITPNRQGLKDLSIFNIDAQFCQQYGTQVFNFSGESTDQFRDLCVSFSGVLDDLQNDIDSLRSRIPVFLNGNSAKAQ